MELFYIYHITIKRDFQSFNQSHYILLRSIILPAIIYRERKRAQTKKNSVMKADRTINSTRNPNNNVILFIPSIIFYFIYNLWQVWFVGFYFPQHLLRVVAVVADTPFIQDKVGVSSVHHAFSTEAQTHLSFLLHILLLHLLSFRLWAGAMFLLHTLPSKAVSDIRETTRS